MLLSKERGYHIIAGIAISLIGLIITVTVHSHKAKYAGLCILLFGSYISAPLTVAWLSGNNPGMFTLNTVPNTSHQTASPTPSNLPRPH
jgi:hypothetical protein